LRKAWWTVTGMYRSATLSGIEKLEVVDVEPR
jgi:hypothetical protein